MLSRLASALPSKQKQQIKTAILQTKAAYVRRFRSYDSEALLGALRDFGISSGDTLFIHASYSATNGFQGSPIQLLATFRAAVGEAGTLLMPSSAYSGLTVDYLSGDEPFDLRRSPSRMGILSEMMRRQRGTLRSLNPAHPVLAAGPDAAWFVAGHEACELSCGPGSPFEKLVEKDAKVLFFDVGILNMMFIHYIEHSAREALPYPLYAEETYEAAVIDAEGQQRSVTVRPFAKASKTAALIWALEAALRSQGLLRERRLGNTALQFVTVRDCLEVAGQLATRDGFLES